MKHIIFLLDMSGSMSSRIIETLDGYNTFISEISNKSETCVSLYTFNSECKNVYKEIPVKDIKPLTNEDYIPHGNTALFDSMGHIFSTHTDTSTLVVLTDGFENASWNYTKKHVKDLIRISDWTVIYIGADIECANEIGIRNSVEYTGDDTASAFRFASQTI